MRFMTFVVPLAAAISSLAQAQQPSSAQIAAVKSSCRGDYMKVCASVPTGTQQSLQCLQQHSSQVSAGCQSALAALTPPGGPAPEAASPPAASAPAAAPTTASMSPRAQARLLRTDCGADFQKFCAGTPLGGGRALGCLKDHGSDLSALCRSALMAAAPK
jgi:Cysteine rich repeat